MSVPALRPDSVLLVGNYENDEQTSMLQFAAALESGLGAAGLQVKTVRPASVFGSLKRGATGAGKWLGYLDKFLLFPGALRREIRAAKRGSKSVVVHICDHSNAHYTRYLQQTSHLVTCNDLLAVRSAAGEFPVNPTRWTGRKLQGLILNGLRRARHVTCISEATRQDLLRLSGLPDDRTSVTYMGFNADFRAPEPAEAARRVSALLEARGIAGKIPSSGYVLHVGSNAWYKNRPGVIRTYAALLRRFPSAPPLVFAGKPLTPELRALAEEHGIGAKMADLGSVNHADLCALYAQAGVLLFPSLEEGFGWPIIEAQTCGTPVATTGKAPMTEVGGDAAEYLPAGDDAGAAAVLEKLLTETPEQRRARVAAGERNAARFSASTMIEGYRELYSRALVNASRNGG